ncbi:MAG TPA: IPT/TIG domain-containing protein, partial [Acidimicrobiales bacterium]|nr:IPT/TIG domain-containing protein [Acidimicrobiales bacterium]
VLAVVVFTDGSRPTRVIDKRTAVAVDPSALPGAPGSTAPSTAPAKDVVSQPQPVDTQLRCKTITQKPRVPVLDQPVPASHSMTLSWTYSLLDNQDCEPTSYLVTVAAVNGGPSPANTQFTVNGQTQFTVPGLRPNTTYSFMVTALINTQSTPSLPRQATTDPEGPDAPLSVTTVANGSSGWTVTWNVCQGDACDSNLPAATWTVTGSSCGSGSQFIGTPPVVTVPGTGGAVQSTTVPFSQFPTLVGDQLTFSVQGTSATGLAGDPTGDRSCTEGWRPADPTAFTVVGTANASGSTSVTATLTVAPNPGETAIQAYGSNNVSFSFSVFDQTSGQTSPPQTGSQPTASFAGLAPGHTYVPEVSVTPLTSPTPGSTVSGAAFGTTVPWPSGITATQVGGVTVTPGNPGTGTAAFSLANVYAVPSASVTASATVTCASFEATGGSGLPVAPTGGGAGSVTVSLDLNEEGGACSVAFTLSDGAGGPYGAGTTSTSGALTVSVPALNVSSGNFTAVGIAAGIRVQSNYGGGGGIGWAINVIPTTPPSCPPAISDTPTRTGGPWTTTVSVPACSTGTTVDVRITYTYSGQNVSIDLGSVAVIPPVVPAPIVTSLSPATGPAAGGTVVTITGTGFTGATSVLFGSSPGTAVTVVSATQITVTSPAGSGAVPVTVTTPAGTSTPGPSSMFTYT